MYFGSRFEFWFRPVYFRFVGHTSEAGLIMGLRVPLWFHLPHWDKMKGFFIMAQDSKGSKSSLRVLKLNKTNLLTLVSEGLPVTIKDSEVNGLKFKVGTKRSVFQYEKCLAGTKKAPPIIL